MIIAGVTVLIMITSLATPQMITEAPAEELTGLR
jgi:hypothetical protein